MAHPEYDGMRIQRTSSWLYSFLKRARRFSGLLEAALLPPEAREVPAIKRDHCSNGQQEMHKI